MIDRKYLPPAVLGAFAAVLATRAVRSAAGRDCSGLVAFVTGGSRGLGLAIAQEFARRGARVAICGRDVQTLERAAQMLRRQGTQILALTCDVREQREIQSAVREAASVFGRLDVLVNNAGTIAVGPVNSMTLRDYQDAMDTHFWAPYYAVEAALPIFRERGGGRIVNVTSIGAKISVPHLLPYCVSKFAAAGYSEGLRAALARERIWVTTVCPGLMRTGSPRNAWFKGRNKREYAWFSLSDSLPGLSIGAGTAARHIVDATMQRRAEIVLSLPAKAIALFHGIAPGATAVLLSAAARMLPAPGGIGTKRAKGFCSTSSVSESAFAALGKKAERDYNQLQ